MKPWSRTLLKDNVSLKFLLATYSTSEYMGGGSLVLRCVDGVAATREQDGYSHLIWSMTSEMSSSFSGYAFLWPFTPTHSSFLNLCSILVNSCFAFCNDSAELSGSSCVEAWLPEITPLVSDLGKCEVVDGEANRCVSIRIALPCRDSREWGFIYIRHMCIYLHILVCVHLYLYLCDY